MMIMSSSYCVHKGKACSPSGTKSRDIGIRAGLVVLAPREHHHVRLGGPVDGKNNDIFDNGTQLNLVSAVISWALPSLPSADKVPKACLAPLSLSKMLPLVVIRFSLVNKAIHCWSAWPNWLLIFIFRQVWKLLNIENIKFEVKMATIKVRYILLKT